LKPFSMARNCTLGNAERDNGVGGWLQKSRRGVKHLYIVF
jgi:hypothetical protein